MKYVWLRKILGGGKILTSLIYLRYFKSFLNWWKPKTINEKINWLNFNSDTTLWTMLSDKLEVRNFVEKKGLKENLVKLYGYWYDPNEIDWSILPNKFVMKMNNGSGDILICKDKRLIDKNKVIGYFTPLFHKQYDYTNGEPHYTKITPCLIAEELLDVSKQAMKSSSLIDYKIWCFNGNPDFVWVCFNRTPDRVDVGSYDLQWNLHPEYGEETNHYHLAEQKVPKPETLERMLDVARVLSEGIPQVRVDLYEVDGQVYFGEMTFTSAGGFMRFYSEKQLRSMGNKIVLPKKQK